MNGGESGFSCGFCRKGFRSLDRKLRHLKACKQLIPAGKGHLPLAGGLRRQREAHI